MQSRSLLRSTHFNIYKSESKSKTKYVTMQKNEANAMI